MASPRNVRFAPHAAFLLWLALLFACLPAGAAEPERVGDVLEVSGVASAQRAGVPDRFVAKGGPIFEGDVITTSNTGYVQLSLKDGTKLTLRPNTTFAVDRLRHDAGEESATFRLVKGGVRALTGLISKRNPNGAQIQTNTATIGIRGTSLDARICTNDCVREEQRSGKPAAATDEPIVARVVVISGSATATSRDGQTRTLTEGAALFNGETVTTALKSHVVLAFRDETKVTVSSDSIFRLEDVRYNTPKGESGSFFVRIAKGSVRTLTGLLGKADPKSVGVRVGIATIGIRGSGFDAGLVASITGGEDNVVVQVWQDGATLTVGGQAVNVNQGQSASFQPGTNLVSLIPTPPAFIPPAVPRPDAIKVDQTQLFSAAQQTVAPGLYVTVRDGDVQLSAVGGTLVPIGKGEVGFLATGSTNPVRITMPQFLINDNFPLPEAGIRSLIIPLGTKPGSLICEIR